MSQKTKWHFLRTRRPFLSALLVSLVLHSLLFLSALRWQTGARDFSVAYASQKQQLLPVPERLAKRRELNPFYIKKKVNLQIQRKLDLHRRQPTSRFTSSKVQRLNHSIQNRIIYPQLAVRRGWQGRVSIAIEVSAAGQAKDIQVTHSSGFQLLDKTAINAIRNWTFERGEYDENLSLHFAFRLQ